MITPPDRKLRWGVLGYARIAYEHVIPAIARTHDSVCHAVASRGPAKLADARARFPEIKNLHASYEALLADPEVDAVYIPLPNSEHCDWTIRAAEAGKHVLCEKPLALTAAECRRMVDACAAHRVVLMEAVMYRFTHRTRQVLEVLASGVLGEIKFVSASFRFLHNRPDSVKLVPALGGGALYDIGVYPINFCGMVADAAAGVAPGTLVPDHVSAESIHVGGIDTRFSGLLRYPTGLIGAIHCGFDAHRRVGAEIVGTTGVLTVPEPWMDAPGTLGLTRGTEVTQIQVPASDRYRYELEDFSTAVRTGRPPGYSLPESLRNAELLDRLLAASKS